MEFIVKNNTYLTKIQKLVLQKAIADDLDISFEDASYEITDYNTKIIIHEEIKETINKENQQQ